MSKVEFPSLDEFMDHIRLVRGFDATKDRGPSTSSYDIIFAQNKEPRLSVARVNGRLVYSEAELSDIADRYTKMVSGIKAMTDVGYEIVDLMLMSNAGYSGVTFKYKTPTGRIHQQNYMRDESSFNVIPDDFLHDVLHLPHRI